MSLSHFSMSRLRLLHISFVMTHKVSLEKYFPEYTAGPYINKFFHHVAQSLCWMVVLTSAVQHRWQIQPTSDWSLSPSKRRYYRTRRGTLVSYEPYSQQVSFCVICFSACESFIFSHSRILFLMSGLAEVPLVIFISTFHALLLMRSVPARGICTLDHMDRISPYDWVTCLMLLISGLRMHWRVGSPTILQPSY